LNPSGGSSIIDYVKTPALNPAPLIASEAIGNESTIVISASAVATDDFIKSRIFTIRGVQVMLDRDLA
jgi:hypothetical protein